MTVYEKWTIVEQRGKWNKAWIDIEFMCIYENGF